MTNDDNNIVRLEGTDWFSAEELAKRLDVSVRTIYRRLERDQIEKRDTARGTVYRVVDDARADTEEVTTADNRAEDKFGEAVLRLVDQTHMQSDKIADLTGRVGRLEARLEAAQEDNHRLLRYVDQADGRLDELVEELEATEAELMQSRARAFLEAGRREMADERLDDAKARAERLESEKEALERRLEKAESATSGWKPFG